MDIDKDCIELVYEFSKEWDVDEGELMCICMLLNEFSLDGEKVKKMDEDYVKGWLRKIHRYDREQFEEVSRYYKSFLDDIKMATFPVPRSSDGRSKWIEYVNSWGYERSYGGNRAHEGTDICALENIRGKYPIVSMTNGTVTAKGWLEKGGYRLGITSDNGVYYYYAHLDSYADGIGVGDKVAQGQLIGYMGDTGYGKIEGTRGKFQVHLHMGMYIYPNGKEISINPYPWIKKSEENVLIYNY